jgi:hypothetical protein
MGDQVGPNRPCTNMTDMLLHCQFRSRTTTSIRCPPYTTSSSEPMPTTLLSTFTSSYTRWTGSPRITETIRKAMWRSG